MDLPIAIERERVAEFCRRHHIRWLALFGSVLRDDFGPDSDVDVLVRFEPEGELTEMLGRKADLRTPEDLSRHFRDRVLSEAVVQYGR